ncbi:MAG: CYTH domain-containing protein [Lachnospiraceae bacterium]|jgi:adenylate cyclase|nr:CYTH domain-containing protein [Lachnospiraceae bacterium]
MEIERKFLVRQLPENLEQYPFHQIEQGYLCTKPVVRVRRQDDEYYLTYKGGGKMVREEYNLPLTAEAYRHLIKKADGHLIQKTRYRIPLGNLTAELDLFTAPGNLIMVEVEFSSTEEADAFNPLPWFAEEVTFSKEYHNSYMSRFGIHNAG